MNNSVRFAYFQTYLVANETLNSTNKDPNKAKMKTKKHV